MSGSRILRRLRRHPLLLVAAVVLLASGLTVTGTTFASFTAETQNSTSTLAGGWVGTASNLNVGVSGYDAELTWTPGTHEVTGQELWGYDNGSSSSCPSSGYSQLATMTSATTSNYTQSNGTSGSLDGHYYCYRMVATSSSSWTGTASFPATQLGLVLTALAVNESVTANNKLDTNDVITVTFNQAFSLTVPPANQNLVCESWDTSGNMTVFLNDVQYGGSVSCSATTTAYRIALTGLNNGTTGHTGTQQVKATLTLSSSAPWTATWTLNNNGQNVTAGATIVGTPSSSILSTNGGTDVAAACTSTTYNCTPTATGNGF